MKLRRFWRQYAPEEKKRSWSKAAPEVSKVLLKKSTPEEKPLLKLVKCSWRIVLLKTSGPEATSSEAALSEAVSFRSCIIRSYVIRSCLIRSHFTRSWRSIGFAKDSKIEESTLQKLSIGFENIAEN
jgi:hypothetical protein